MKIQSLVVVLFFISLNLFSFTSCKKINEATELGSDLIPPIDNVSTFDTTLTVEAYNSLFTPATDTTTASVIQFLGNINNDPLFGKSEGSLYFQLMPSSIRRPFAFAKDSLVALDSIVLVLDYISTYGDSTQPQQVGVFEIPTTQNFSSTQNYKIASNPITMLGASIAPTKTFVPQNLNDSTFPRGERTANQLRIPLNNSFGMRLLNYDTLNAYQSDSAFKTFFKGFAVVPQNNGMANALIGVDLASTSTRLAFYVRYKNAGKIDTASTSFTLSGNSAIADYIKRDYGAAEIASAVTGSTPDPLVYLQASPGSFARVWVPALGSLNNSVVHLAELIVEQVYDPLSPTFPPPALLYLDAFDSVKQRYRTIPFDVAVTIQDGNTKADSISGIIANPAQFGMIGKKRLDNLGKPITEWRFNLSRYVQRVVNDTEPAQEFRLYVPFPVIRANTFGIEQFITSGLPYAVGRVRVGGGNHPTQKMRMRVVYSKI